MPDTYIVMCRTLSIKSTSSDYLLLFCQSERNWEERYKNRTKKHVRKEEDNVMGSYIKMGYSFI